MPPVKVFSSRSGAGTMIGLIYNNRATGKYSTAFGYGNTASGDYSFAAGNGNTAVGVDSVAAGISCTANANAVALGYGNTASGDYSFAAGAASTASNSYSVAAGASSTASGVASVVLGYSNNASGGYSFAAGIGALASRYGQASHASGYFAARGDAQASKFVLRNQTTDATATEVKLDGLTNYLTIAATRTMSFVIRVAAHRTDVSGTAAAWPSITGGITRDATGNCRLLGSIAGAGTTTMCDAGASTWSVAVTADSTNNRLAITVTGEAGKTIRWVASVDMAEVG